jgi:hypothetical protein
MVESVYTGVTLLKVYGPYKRQDGRSVVIHYDTVTKTKRTQSYPRYLMEQYLGRKLDAWEQVDHIDGDCGNDVVENYQLLTRAQNNIKAIEQAGRQAKFIACVCPTCNTKFSVNMVKYRENQVKRGCAGPYCSKSCAGKMHH